MRSGFWGDWEVILAFEGADMAGAAHRSKQADRSTWCEAVVVKGESSLLNPEVREEGKRAFI